MKKLINNLAILVLVCFISTSVAGGAWGEDMIKTNDNSDVTYSIQYKDGLPQINKEFKIIVKASYKDEFLLHLHPINNDAFKVINSFGESTTESDKNTANIQRFMLRAPSTAGTYICSFEGITLNGEGLLFSAPIKVYSGKTGPLNIGFIACVFIGAVLCGGMGYGIGQLDNNPWPLALLGAGSGATCGAIIGIFLFPESKEDIK